MSLVEEHPQFIDKPKGKGKKEDDKGKGKRGLEAEEEVAHQDHLVLSLDQHILCRAIDIR